MWSFLKILDRLNSDAASQFEPARRAVMALSLDQAKRQATQVLADPIRFQSERATPEEQSAKTAELRQLAAEVREVVGYLARAQPVNGDFILGLNYLSPAFSNPALFRIGTDIESEVVVRPSEEQVLIIAPDTGSLEQADSYPSIYHYILFNNALLQG